MSITQLVKPVFTCRDMHINTENNSPLVSNPDLSVIIPAYNEAEAIILLVKEISLILNGKIRHEIIIVDDGSMDETSNVLIQLMHDPGLQLRLLQHAANYGQSAAIFTGIQSSRAPWVVTLDGDGQNDPNDIFKLLDKLNVAQDPELKLICGYRKKRHDNLIRRFSSIVANAVRSKILQDSTPDTGCGLKLIHRSTFLSLPFFDHMHRFIPALMKRAGAGIISVEVSHRPRKTGMSKYSINNRLWVGIIDLFGMLWLIKRYSSPVKKEVTRYDF
jgi:dolichol-phosphate mannosyltransferase